MIAQLACLHACAGGGEPPAVPTQRVHDDELYLYRDRTLALLRRYFRLSFEVGRLPSLLGREVFRSRVTHYRMRGFEDAVIFVYDVERCLERLQPFGKAVVQRMALLQYSLDEAAESLRQPRRTVARQYAAALDQLSRILLDSALLLPFPCQYPSHEELSGTPSRQTK